MKRFFLVFYALTAFASDKAGEFDYYILALSWNAGWCEYEGERKGAEECDPQHDYGFRLHGLWPQYEEGWPQFCQSAARNPSRGETAREADLFGSSGLAWHQWNKHGRCTGLEADAYYDLSRQLFESFNQPDVLLALKAPKSAPSSVIEEAVIEENIGLMPDGVSVICKDGLLTELRICLDRAFKPMACMGRAAEDCRYSPKIMPVR